MQSEPTATALVRQAAILVLLVIAAGAGFLIGRSGHTGAAAPGATDGLWTCSMHPQVVRDAPGRCPICHMELIPARTGAGGGATQSPQGSGTDGSIAIDADTVQKMGVRTATITEGPVTRTVRALGSLEEAQPNIHDINLRVSGWVKQVYVTSEGQHIEAGSPLFDLYSPELNLAIEELIAAHKTQNADASLFEAAARRLELLGLDKAQIDSLARLERAPEAVTFRSPISGHVTEKPIVDGVAVKAGDRILRLVDHTVLWIEARVFERDLPYIKLGARATATVASRPRNVYAGEIVFIHPHVDMNTRAGTVRMEVKNAGLALKPGMYATVQVQTQVEERAVLAPREAVLDSGESQVAIVALGEGRFEPRPVKMGLSSDDGMVQIVSGLAAGDEVVTSGQFLIDSESRLREALRRFESQGMGTDRAGSGGATGSSSQTAPTPPAKPVPSMDAVMRAYLDIADTLGAEQKVATAVPMDSLISAAAQLKTQTAGSALEKHATTLSALANSMKKQDIESQRKSFKALSEAMITLAEAAPPSNAVGDSLYVMECPMFPGRWIQRKEDLANPFYATDMKECGSHVKVIKTRAGDSK